MEGVGEELCLGGVDGAMGEVALDGNELEHDVLARVVGRTTEFGSTRTRRSCCQGYPVSHCCSEPYRVDALPISAVVRAFEVAEATGALATA